MHLGIGVSSYFEMCGLAPSRVLASLNYTAGGWESATVRVTPTNKVQVITGATPHGQGHETSWSMIVADRLGVDPADVEVLHSDTAISPLGMDTYGSRSLAVGGVAIYQAIDKVIDKARLIAAHLMEAAPEDLDFEAGTFSVRGSPDHNLPLAAVAFEAFTAHNLPDGVEPNLEAHVTYDPPNFSWPFGTHICVVEVDEETGAVEVVSYVAVDDCGNQINPLIVEGQVHGGVVQGPGPGPLRGSHLRRRRQPDHLQPGRVPGAGRLGRALHHHRLDHHPQPDQPAGREGRGRGGHHRRRPGRHQRRGRRPGAARRDRRGHAGIAPARVVRHPGRQIRVTRFGPGRQRRSPMIPAAFDYVRADSPDQAISLLDRARRRGQAHRRRPLAAAPDEAAAGFAVGAHRRRPPAATCPTSATAATTWPSGP